MSLDPVITNPEAYRVIFENERVRVLQYEDNPGHRTTPHAHPDSVMITQTAFRRRLGAGGQEADVEMPAGAARWVGAQEHYGENIGSSDTRVVFVELKEPRPDGSVTADPVLGPSSADAAP